MRMWETTMKDHIDDENNKMANTVHRNKMQYLKKKC